MDAHVVKLLIDVRYLFVAQRKGLSVAQIFDCIELIDNQGVSVYFLNLFQACSQILVGNGVDVSLLGSVVEDSTTNLEEVLSDVLCEAIEVALFSVDKQLLFLLVENCINFD